MFIKNTLENVIEMTAILSRPQYVKPQYGVSLWVIGLIEIEMNILEIHYNDHVNPSLHIE